MDGNKMTTQPSEDGLFVVVAHRWGWTNGHWYLVGGSTRRSDAVNMAAREADDRSGKYGVAVYRLCCDENAGTGLEAYFPSTYDEKRPIRNPRLDVFQQLGSKVFFAVEMGTADLPDKDDADVLRTTAVEVPDWLRKEKERIESVELKIERLVRWRTEAGRDEGKRR